MGAFDRRGGRRRALIDEEDSGSDQERAEAEALARAFEGEVGTAPSDAMETAALLRAVGGKSELSGERARAVYAVLEPAVEHYVQPRSSSFVVLAGLGMGLAAAAGLALHLTDEEPSHSAAVGRSRAVHAGPDLPAPSSVLLAAQAAVSAEGAPGTARGGLEREMREYRAALLRALKSSYPAEIGMLAIEQAHARADAAPAEARNVLAQALAAPVPREVKAEHRRVVHQDLSFRLALAELGERRFAEALAAADSGLALGRPADLFVANLWVARGEALEGLGRRAEAASAYFDALEINRELLRHALGP